MNNKQIEAIRAKVIADEEYISECKGHQIIHPSPLNVEDKRFLLDHIDKMEKQLDAMREAVKTAYECGHDDTVESNYCDPEERCEEIIDEALNK